MNPPSRFAEYLAKRNARPDANPLDRPLRVTFFESASAQAKTEAEISLRALIPRLTSTTAASKAALPWLKLATFGDTRSPRGSLRHDANVLAIDGAEADYDGESITLDRGRAILAGANLAAILYTSPSHTEATPRWRVLCPTSKSLAPIERVRMVARINGLFVGALAKESFTLSQSYFYGCITGSDAHQVLAIEGRAVDLADDLDAEAVGKPEPPRQQIPEPHTPRHYTPITMNGGTPYGLAALDGECDAIRNAWEGNKHHALNKAAFSVGGLVAAGELEEGPAMAALADALASIRTQCKDYRHAQNTLATAFRDGMGKPRDIPEYVPPAPPAEEVHPAAAFLAKLQTKRQATEQPAEFQPPPALAVAPEILQPGGLLQALMDECAKSAIRPQPLLALGAAICAVGTLAGRLYRSKTDLRTNIYIAAIAESGGGKDHAPEVIRRCFDLAGLGHYLGGETVASGRAVLSSLEQHPVRLFQIDELGLFLNSVTGAKAPSHKAEIWSELMKLYSRAKGTYRGTEYANKKENPRVDICQPCVCFYGTTTPSTFWRALEGGAMLDGSLARFLVFVTDNDRPDRNRDAGIVKPPQSLLDGLIAVTAGQGAPPLGKGNLPRPHVAPMAAGEEPTPYTVPMSAGAEKLHDTKLADEDTWARKVAGTPQAAIVNRLGENAIKLALVHAISRSPAAPIMDEAAIAWGWQLAEHCTRTLLQDAGRHIADNEFERRLNKLLNILAKHGTCSKRELWRYGFRVSNKDFDETARALIEGGAITLVAAQAPSGAGRPPAPRFRLVTEPN